MADSITMAGASKASAAERVLFLPELLEKILDYAHLCDVFRAAAVCRTWRTIFDASHPLQAKAQLKNDPSCDWFEDEFDEELGLCICSQAPDLANDGITYFFLEFMMKEHQPLKLTVNLRKCLATQPACTEMCVIPWCCSEDFEYIRSETGVTIGDIVDAARRVCAEHEHCPEMIQKSRDVGYGGGRHSVARYSLFRGQVRLANDHPVRKQAIAKQVAVRKQDAERVKKYEEAGWSEIWYAFRKARRDAAANGQNLPRWPEFIASNPELAPRGHTIGQAEADAASVTRQLTSMEEEDTTAES